MGLEEQNNSVPRPRSAARLCPEVYLTGSPQLPLFAPFFPSWCSLFNQIKAGQLRGIFSEQALPRFAAWEGDLQLLSYRMGIFQP